MNNKRLVIRQEQEKDFNEVYMVVKSAFEKTEIGSGDEQDFVVRMRKSKEFVPELSLVAELDGEIVGHISFLKVQIGEKTALTLAPVSVIPQYQLKGIGSKLIKMGHDIAKELGFEVVVLVGHKDYYPKFGYVKASMYGIKSPFEVPGECFMVLELKDGALENINGTIEYAPMFFSA